MQDIFFQLWKGTGSYREGRGSLGAWLAVVARNRAIDSLRRKKPTDSVEDVVLPAKTDLASESERNLMIEKVRVVMKGLTPEQQSLVELAFFEGMSHSEIAAKTGDALGTVKTRIRTALMTLRKGVQGDAGLTFRLAHSGGRSHTACVAGIDGRGVGRSAGACGGV